jgi:hypothetical protein
MADRRKRCDRTTGLAGAYLRGTDILGADYNIISPTGWRMQVGGVSSAVAVGLMGATIMLTVVAHMCRSS